MLHNIVKSSLLTLTIIDKDDLFSLRVFDLLLNCPNLNIGTKKEYNINQFRNIL